MQTKKYMSLGAGVQSTYLFLASCRGVLPRVDAAIFSDTGWEPDEVYENLAFLQEESKAYGIPLIVTAREYQGKAQRIQDETLHNGKVLESGTRRRGMTLPIFTKRSGPIPWKRHEVEIFRQRWNAELQDWQEVLDDEQIDDEEREEAIQKTEYFKAQLYDLFNVELALEAGKTPLRDLKPGEGQTMRSCTKIYKIEPVERMIKRLLGLQPKQRVPADLHVEHWFGISADEKQRMRISDKPWKTFVYPLCNVPRSFGREMSRADCMRWLNENYPGRHFPRSSCIGCPYHSREEWLNIKSNPKYWDDAVRFDRAIRNFPMIDGELFLHRQRVPLDQVDFGDDDPGLDKIASSFDEECEGMCGV